MPVAVADAQRGVSPAPASMSRPASAPSSSCAPTSTRRVGPRSSAASAGSAARSRSRPATASRCSSPRPTASARRPRIAAARRAVRHDRHRPRRDVRRRRRVHAAPSRSPSSTTWRSGGSTRSASPSSSAASRPAVARPARAGRRRDGRASGLDRRRRVRSRRLLHRRRRAVAAYRRHRAVARRRRDRRPGVDRACMRTATRSCASLIAQWDLDLAEPYQARLRRTLGDAATDARPGAAPNESLATLGEVLLTPTRDLCARDPGRTGRPDGRRDIHGLAHITGGGLPGNVPRAFPERPRRSP